MGCYDNHRSMGKASPVVDEDGALAIAMGEISAINQFHFIFNLNFIEMLPPAVVDGVFWKGGGKGKLK